MLPNISAKHICLFYTLLDKSSVVCILIYSILAYYMYKGDVYIYKKRVHVHVSVCEKKQK